jgi:hypothetical protein
MIINHQRPSHASSSDPSMISISIGHHLRLGPELVVVEVLELGLAVHPQLRARIREADTVA